MTIRSRTKDLRSSISGTIAYWDGTVYDGDTTLIGTEMSCDDVVGNWEGANPFSLSTIYRSTPVIEGYRWDDIWEYKSRLYNGFPIGYHAQPTPDPRDVYGVPSLGEQQILAWKILAETNPSRPHVNVPAFLGELKDIPGMVRDWGRNYMRSGVTQNVARTHLTWRWFVKPLISDLRKLHKFAELSSQRMKELTNLRDGKAIRKRVKLSADQQSTSSGVLLNSATAWVTGTVTTNYKQRTWGSAEWVLPSDTRIAKMDDDELKRFGVAVNLGLGDWSLLEAAWELTPWSWLIDWFSNVGDMMSALNNTVPATFRRLCIMRTSEARTTLKDVEFEYRDRFASLSGPLEWIHIRKERFPTFPITPFPLPSLPVLNAGKLSILASLAALRRLKPLGH